MLLAKELGFRVRQHGVEGDVEQAGFRKFNFLNAQRYQYMGYHIIKWAKLKLVERHYDPYGLGHKGHNGVRPNLTWPI